MTLIRATYALLSAAWLGVSACGQVPQAPLSSIQTVNIPQTDVRDQGRFGIC